MLLGAGEEGVPGHGKGCWSSSRRRSFKNFSKSSDLEPSDVLVVLAVLGFRVKLELLGKGSLDNRLFVSIISVIKFSLLVSPENNIDWLHGKNEGISSSIPFAKARFCLVGVLE